jgi:integrase
MTAPLALPPSSGDEAWPDDDVLVLRNRPIRDGATALSRFGDDVWRVQAAHPDAHLGIRPLSWRQFPAPLRRAFKTFFLAALDHPYPRGPGFQRAGERPSVATFAYWFPDLSALAAWMHARHIDRLADLREADLADYHRHVLALARTAGRKVDMLSVVRTLWLYAPHLPAECRIPGGHPWGSATSRELVNAPAAKGENKTPRIAPATMEALLGWALRMIDDIGPDIVSARQECQLLDDGNHPSQAIYQGMTLGPRLELFLDHAQRTQTPLPGSRRRGAGRVNCCHVLRLVGITQENRGTPSRHQQRLLDESGLPIEKGSYIGSIRGSINGQPWRDTPISTEELHTLVRLLSAACFLIICYLSGMRPGEVLNLRRGCRDLDAQTGQLLVRGRPGKGYDRAATTTTVDGAAQRPWVVVQPVHDAIAMLERLHAFPLLFPASLTSAQARRPNTHHARQSHSITLDLQDFSAWVNTTFVGADGAPPIPPDPTRHLHAARFRRTLAYFIVRRPRGLVAAALQYGHVSTKVTLNYAGEADTSWMDDLAVERLELALEQNEQDWTQLRTDEHVSGPAADEYRARVAGAARFTGRVVSSRRNVHRLLTQVDTAIHHAEAMTCVWQGATAACHTANLELGLPAADTPDTPACRSSCQNLAYTDRDIGRLRIDLQRLTADANDPAAPRPLRERAAARAEHIRAVIERHDATRPDLPEDR